MYKYKIFFAFEDDEDRIRGVEFIAVKEQTSADIYLLIGMIAKRQIPEHGNSVINIKRQVCEQLNDVVITDLY